MELKIKKIKDEALKELKGLKDSKALENFKNKYFGRKSGLLLDLMKDLKGVSEDIRPKLGALANTVKKEIEERYEKQAKVLTRKALELAEEKEWIDTTVSIDKYRIGH